VIVPSGLFGLVFRHSARVFYSLSVLSASRLVRSKILVSVFLLPSRARAASIYRPFPGTTFSGTHLISFGANTVTAYLLQQVQLLARRDRHGLAPWSTTGNRPAEPAFQLGYEAGRSQRAPDAFRLSQ